MKNIFYPLIKNWTAILKDGSIKQHSIQDVLEKDLPFLSDLDTKQVMHFWYTDAIGNKLYGVDVQNQIFIINSQLVKLYLPEGEYRLIATMRTPQDSTQPNIFVRKFTFGMQATIEGKNEKLLFAVMPDGSVVQEDY